MSKDEFVIERAERKQALLRLSFCGPSFCGKTWTTLLVARGLLKAMLAAGIVRGTADRKIGVVDTERKSARLYGPHLGPFDVIELGPPYTTERYLKAIRTFEVAGYPIIIIDQISHAWAGAGGLLELKNDIAKREGRNSFDAFADITPMQNDFIEQILSSPAHIMCTMRSKTAWVLESYTTKSGHVKHKPRRIGMAPVQREGSEYEFTTMLNMQVEGNAIHVVKDRTQILKEGQDYPALTEEYGEMLAKWLYTGDAPADGMRDINATPAERADAVCKTWEGTLKACTSLPDLARDFQKAIDAIRVIDYVGGHVKKTLADRLTATKDELKKVLPPEPAKDQRDTGEPLIGPDDVAQLEKMIQEANIPAMIWNNEWRIVRLSQLPAAKFDDFKDWIDAQAVVAKRGAA